MTDTIRAFIALELPDEAKAVLVSAGQQMTPTQGTGGVRWVQPDRMHLTLRFLGDTGVSHLPLIARQLDALAEAHTPFDLQLGSVGCFPNRKRPRVIWVGLQQPSSLLQALQQDLEIRLQPLGWEPEGRPFQAHLTLGRVKDSRLAADLNWNVKVKPVQWMVTAVHLIESQLQRSGPVYTIRHSSRLRAVS